MIEVNGKASFCFEIVTNRPGRSADLLMTRFPSRGVISQLFNVTLWSLINIVLN